MSRSKRILQLALESHPDASKNTCQSSPEISFNNFDPPSISWDTPILLASNDLYLSDQTDNNQHFLLNETPKCLDSRSSQYVSCFTDNDEGAELAASQDFDESTHYIIENSNNEKSYFPVNTQPSELLYCVGNSSNQISNFTAIDTSIENESNEDADFSIADKLDDPDFTLENFESGEMISSDNDTASEKSSFGETNNPVDSVLTKEVQAIEVQHNNVSLVAYSDSEDNSSTKKESDNLTTKNKRKRVKRHEVNESFWHYRKQKTNREKGLSYKGRKKINDKWQYCIQKVSRTLKTRCKCDMSKKPSKINCGLISDTDREGIFQQFWGLSWKEKKIYSNMLMTMNSTKRPRDRKEQDTSKRKYSIEYYLKKGDERIRVCKKMFHATLGIGQWTSLNWKKSERCAVNLNDESMQVEETDDDNSNLEGQAMLNAKNKYKKRQKPFLSRIKSLEDFFSNLPVMESHYCRASSTKLYTEPIWKSKSELYNFYVNDWCRTKTEKPLSIATFSHTFEKRNLSLYRPKKDECDVCVAYRTKNLSEAQFHLHQTRKEEARIEKQQDKENKSNVYTMDLQSVLLSPMSNVSSLYYKTKLTVHNFTLYNLQTKDGMCYLWNESEGALTAQEFSSILSDFISCELLPLSVENSTLTLYSDGCTYQNRNAVLANALLNIAVLNNLTIEQKYLEKGHTQMEADSMHSCIERQLKNKKINVPADYVSVCLAARKRPRPYKVKYLDHSFFKNFQQVQAYNSIRPGRTTGDTVVTDLRALQYNPNGKIYYKLRFTDNWTELPVRKNKAIIPVPFNQLPQLYCDRLKIKKIKFDHLQLLKKSLEPDYHSFYDSIPHL